MFNKVVASGYVKKWERVLGRLGNVGEICSFLVVGIFPNKSNCLK